MKRINPYIGFKGKSREAMAFYKSIFGGELSFMTVGECPPEVQEQCGDNKDAIMHSQLEVGPSLAIMGTDMGAYDFDSAKEGNSRISIAIDCADKAEIEKLYKALGEGGSFGCPLGPAFWGGLFGMATDKYGVNWLLTCTE